MKTPNDLDNTAGKFFMYRLKNKKLPKHICAKKLPFLSKALRRVPKIEVKKIISTKALINTTIDDGKNILCYYIILLYAFWNQKMLYPSELIYWFSSTET